MYRTFPSPRSYTPILPLQCSIYLCLSSPRDPSIVPSYATLPRSALSADRSPFQFQFRHTGYRGQPPPLILMNVATRDRLKHRSIVSFAVTRAQIKNLMRADLCANNRVMNRTSVMTQSDDAILTSRTRNYARSLPSSGLIGGFLVIPQ